MMLMNVNLRDEDMLTERHSNQTTAPVVPAQVVRSAVNRTSVMTTVLGFSARK